MNAQLQRKINVIKMFTKEKEWNYEEPNMTYDKETGDVTIHASIKSQRKKRIINSVDDVEKLRKQLEKEQGLEEDGLPKEGADLNHIKQKLVDDELKMLEERLEIDPSNFYAFTTDMMRIDVGLII